MVYGLLPLGRSKYRSGGLIMKSNIEETYLISERLRIGSLIKKRRDDKGLTSQQLADEMGISRSTISKIEAGKWNFGIDTLSTFASFLDFDVVIKDK